MVKPLILLECFSKIQLHALISHGRSTPRNKSKRKLYLILHLDATLFAFLGIKAHIQNSRTLGHVMKLLIEVFEKVSCSFVQL